MHNMEFASAIEHRVSPASRSSDVIRIIPFASQHAEEVGSLIVGIQRDEFQIAITLEDQPDLQDIPGFYQRGAGNFWVALSEGQVVGTVALLDLGNRQGALRKMFVHASYRGPGHGVSARLLETLLEWSRARRERGLPRHNREVPRRASLLRAKRISANRSRRTAPELPKNEGGHSVLPSRTIGPAYSPFRSG